MTVAHIPAEAVEGATPKAGPCDVCGWDKAISPFSLTMHKRRMHGDLTGHPARKGRDVSPCQYCGKTLTTKFLRQHYRNMHRETYLGEKEGASKAVVHVPRVRRTTLPNPDPTLTIVKDSVVVTDGTRIGILHWVVQ